MQDSMMIADVGDMLKVSGSRIAMPLAPPSPGSTPMMTPSVMPSTISMMLYGWSTTEKPWNRLPISSIMSAPKPHKPSLKIRNFKDQPSKPKPVFQRPLGQRHQKPALE